MDDSALTGRLIDDRYEVRELLGAGSFGDVYRGLQLNLGRGVAIKVLRPEWRENERCVALFRAEARAAASISHPSVVSVLDCGETDDRLLYIVLELVRGRPLRELTTEPMAVGRATALLGQILSGLDCAHRAQVVHADLKADNVLITQSLTGDVLAKIVDFGAARFIARRRAERATTVCGTPEYLAPEAISGDEPSPLCDVYAAGVLLYELLAGHLPFTGAGIEVMEKHLLEAPPPLAEARPDLPEALVAVVERAMAKRPEERFQSADEMRTALLRAGGCEDVSPWSFGGVRTAERLDTEPLRMACGTPQQKPAHTSRLTNAIGIALRMGQVNRLPALYLRLSERYVACGDYETAVKELEEGIDAVVFTGAAPNDLWMLYLRTAVLQQLIGRSREALRNAYAARRHAHQAGAGRGVTQCMDLLRMLLDAEPRIVVERLASDQSGNVSIVPARSGRA